jgi:cell division protein FtsB
MPQVASPGPGTPRSDSQPLYRRRRVAPPPASSGWPARLLKYVIVFLTAVLLIDSLIGSSGLIEALRARRQYAALAADLDQKRRENADLRDEIRRLREDPATIESIARQELGLMRQGEVLVVVHDDKE